MAGTGLRLSGVRWGGGWSWHGSAPGWRFFNGARTVGLAWQLSGKLRFAGFTPGTPAGCVIREIRNLPGWDYPTPCYLS